MHLKSRVLLALKGRRLVFSTFNRIPRGWIYDTIPVSSLNAHEDGVHAGVRYSGVTVIVVEMLAKTQEERGSLSPYC